MKGWFNSEQQNYMALVWVLVLINLLVITWWLAKISTPAAVVFILTGVSGMVAFFFFNQPRTDEAIPAEISRVVKGTMEEFQPIADKVFERILADKIKPLTESFAVELGKNMAWLWESGHKFAAQIVDGLDQVKERLFRTSGINLSSEMYQLQKSLEDRIDSARTFLVELERPEAKAQDELKTAISRQTKQMRASLEPERVMATRYIENLLTSQLTEWATQEGEVPVPQVERMLDQFTVLAEKSVEGRLDSFKEDLLAIVEELFAQAIGKLQKETLFQINGLRQLGNQVERLINNPRAPRGRLEGTKELLNQLQEEINDIMVTLAWQDLLVEKRWQEIIQRLGVIQKEVFQTRDSKQMEMAQDCIAREIVGFDSAEMHDQYRPIYEALVMAEIMYRGGLDNRPEIDNPAHTVLQFAKTVEEMARERIALSAQLLGQRRLIRDEVKEGEYDSIFDQVLTQVRTLFPGMEAHLQGIYPYSFYNFCVSPGVSYQPDNCVQAAWMLFIILLSKGQEQGDTEMFLLVGLLLMVHLLRNRYIHPSSSSQAMQKKDSFNPELMRDCSFRAIALLLRLEL